MKNKIFFTSIIILILISILAIFADRIAPFSYDTQNIDMQLQGISSVHIMGTDSLGRDLFSRILYGARISMTVGVLTAIISIILGTFFGCISGYFGGWIDNVLMRFVDLFIIFPNLLLSILVMVIVGHSISGILISLGLVSWVYQARLVRGQVLQIKQNLHIEAAKALGANTFQIIKKHIAPFIFGPLLVSLTFQIPSAILSESFLSFLGIGIQPPHASWGTLANEGFRGMRSYPHLILFPGIVLYLTLMAFQYFGDGLRDYFDSKKNIENSNY